MVSWEACPGNHSPLNQNLPAQRPLFARPWFGPYMVFWRFHVIFSLVCHEPNLSGSIWLYSCVLWFHFASSTIIMGNVFDLFIISCPNNRICSWLSCSEHVSSCSSTYVLLHVLSRAIRTRARPITYRNYFHFSKFDLINYTVNK